MGNCAFMKLVPFISCRNARYSPASVVHNTLHFSCLFWFEAIHYLWSWALYVSCKHLHCLKSFNTVRCSSPLLVLHALTILCFVLLCAFLCLVIQLLTCATEQWKISCTLALFAKQYVPVTRETNYNSCTLSQWSVCVLVQHSILLHSIQKQVHHENKEKLCKVCFARKCLLYKRGSYTSYVVVCIFIPTTQMSLKQWL